MDGAVYHNNPIHIAEQERKLLWPGLRNDHPDIIVSIGTTYKQAAGSSSAHKSPHPNSPRVATMGVVSHGKSLFRIAIDHITSALDSEKTWESYLGILHPPSSHRDRYVRLNPQLEEQPPRLDQVEQMDNIRALARINFSNDARIQRIANQLIATVFYFETSSYREITPDGAIECSGVYCWALVTTYTKSCQDTYTVAYRQIPRK